MARMLLLGVDAVKNVVDRKKIRAFSLQVQNKIEIGEFSLSAPIKQYVYTAGAHTYRTTDSKVFYFTNPIPHI